MSKQDMKQIEEMLLAATPAEKQKIREMADNAISEEAIKEAQKPKTLINIENFNDKRVLPFSAKSGNKAVYEVFNKKNNDTTIMDGQGVIGLFGGSDDEKKNFEAKLYGDTHTVNGYRIKFKHFETY